MLLKPIAMAATSTAFLAARTTAPEPSGALGDYSGLGSAEGRLAKWRDFADPALLKESARLYIAMPTFSADVAARISPEHQAVLAQSLARAFCDAASRDFEVVSAPDNALSARIVVTDVRTTNRAVAAMSSVMWVRVPVGLGGLTVEAEALTPSGKRAAALLWSRTADPMSGARLSQIGDAYDFTNEFGEAFGRLVRRGDAGSRGLASAVGVPTRAPNLKADDPCSAFGGTRLGVGAAAMFSPIQPPPRWVEKRATEGAKKRAD